mmetsp:Transcript_3331/g.20784  ORF Transcript_3331/g.20784 Transcript_3331/m.20784 type:complete len:202 (+) Transcript_3331:1172-1777(+)
MHGLVLVASIRSLLPTVDGRLEGNERTLGNADWRRVQRNESIRSRKTSANASPTLLGSARERVREHAVSACIHVDRVRVHGGPCSFLSQPSGAIAQRMARALSGRGGRMRAFGTRRDGALGVSWRRTPQLQRREHAVERVRRRLEEGRVPMDGSVVSDGLGRRRSNERGRAWGSVLLMERGSPRRSGRMAVGKLGTSRRGW